jgi:Uma2 family endonuclease
MATQERLYTVADYEALILQYPDRRFELINGEIVEKMPTMLHSAIVSLIITYLVTYFKLNPIAWALPEAHFNLPEDDKNARVPDVSVVLREGRTLLDEGMAPFMPELAIEVQSPSQSNKFMVDKAKYYLDNGVRIVWLFYPKKHLIEVLSMTDRQLLTLEDTLTGGDLLPGFSAPVRELFPE